MHICKGEEPNKYLCFCSNPVNLIYSQCMYVIQLNYMKQNMFIPFAKPDELSLFG